MLTVPTRFGQATDAQALSLTHPWMTDAVIEMLHSVEFDAFGACSLRATSSKLRAVVDADLWSIVVDRISERHDVRMPAGLRHLRLGDRFDQPLDDVDFPTGLLSVKFGAAFAKILPYQLPPSMTELRFQGGREVYVHPEFLPPRLRVLDFGACLVSVSGRAVFPDSLEELNLGWQTNAEVNCGLLPSGLRSFRYCGRRLSNVNDLPRTLTSLDAMAVIGERFDAERMPSGLRELVVHDTLEHSSSASKCLPSLTRLKWIRTSEGIHERVAFPAGLKELDLVDFRRPIRDLALPTGLTSLRLDREFRGDVPKGSLTPCLTKLHLGHRFDGRLDLSDLTSLRSLRLSTNFDQPLHWTALPASLTRLKFGEFFNDTFDLVGMPALTTIKFTGRFSDVREDGSCGPEHLPTCLTHLDMGLHFKRNARLRSMTNLQTLVFGGSVWSSDRNDLPPNLTALRLGRCSELPFGLSDLRSLRSLTIRGTFNVPLRAGDLPSSLTKLKLGGDFAQPADLRQLTALRRLTLPGPYNSATTLDTLGRSVERIEFSIHTDACCAPNSSDPAPGEIIFPPKFNRTCDLHKLTKFRSITFGHGFDRPVTSRMLPVTLVSLTFGRGFDESVDLRLLPVLRHLRFGCGFDRALAWRSLPPSLVTLRFGCRFDTSVNLRYLLKLRTLVFSGIYSHPLSSGNVPPGLDELQMVSDHGLGELVPKWRRSEWCRECI